MLITDKLTITPSCKDYDYYESLGYVIPKVFIRKHNKELVKRDTQITVNVKDLTTGSHARVLVKCDYCGSIKEVTYKDYLKNHDGELGDCCVKCRPIKHRNTMLEKYGVENSMKMDGMLDKIKEHNNEKFGCDWPQMNKEVREKSIKTMLEKYGVEHALQYDEFHQKAWDSMKKNGYSYTSKPQIKLSEMLKEIYGNCELEVPCGRCSLDCLVNFNGVKIDVEYDGWYWHQDKERDTRRDNFIKSKGYKVLRVKSNNKNELPTKEQLQEHIQMLIDGYNYTEIIMQ